MADPSQPTAADLEVHEVMLAEELECVLHSSDG
jgi:hypothetical protein